MHRYGGRFYPGTRRLEDVGRGSGFGYNLNVPLERGTDGQSYLVAFERWVVPAVWRYSPSPIFSMSSAPTATWPTRSCVLASRFPPFASSRAESGSLPMTCATVVWWPWQPSSAPEHVARCWAVVLAILSNAWGDDDREVWGVVRRRCRLDRADGGESQQPPPRRPGHRFGSASRVQLCENGANVELDRVIAHIQSAGDCLVREAKRQQPEHLPLAFRERRFGDVLVDPDANLCRGGHGGEGSTQGR